MTTGGPTHVVFVPGADARPFREDLAEAPERGVVAHPLERLTYLGHRIDDAAAYYDDVSAAISLEVRRIRRHAADACIVGVGRNLGGGLLAYHAARTPDFAGLIFTGTVPELSKFRRFSGHQGARAFRDSLLTPDDIQRIDELRPLDLVESLAKLDPEICLLQVGILDPWMDDAAFDAFRALEARFEVEWFDDDHAMVSPAAVEARWAFIARIETGQSAS